MTQPTEPPDQLDPLRLTLAQTLDAMGYPEGARLLEYVERREATDTRNVDSLRALLTESWRREAALESKLANVQAGRAEAIEQRDKAMRGNPQPVELASAVEMRRLIAYLRTELQEVRADVQRFAPVRASVSLGPEVRAVQEALEVLADYRRVKAELANLQAQLTEALDAMPNLCGEADYPDCKGEMAPTIERLRSLAGH